MYSIRFLNLIQSSFHQLCWKWFKWIKKGHKKYLYYKLVDWPIIMSATCLWKRVLQDLSVCTAFCTFYRCCNFWKWSKKLSDCQQQKVNFIFCSVSVTWNEAVWPGNCFCTVLQDIEWACTTHPPPPAARYFHRKIFNLLFNFSCKFFMYDY